MRMYMYDIMMGSTELTPEQKEKEKECKAELDTHIKNVQDAWENMKNNQAILDYIAIEGGLGHAMVIPTIDMIISAHDSSKYGIEEWEPYRQHWHSVDDNEKNESKIAYDGAWEHHYMNNMHHPEYWLRKKNDMPLTAVVEMCCDWIAMSKAKGGDAYHWFLDNEEKHEQLGENQQEWTVFILKKYYNIKND